LQRRYLVIASTRSLIVATLLTTTVACSIGALPPKIDQDARADVPATEIGQAGNTVDGAGGALGTDAGPDIGGTGIRDAGLRGKDGIDAPAAGGMSGTGGGWFPGGMTSAGGSGSGGTTGGRLGSGGSIVGPGTGGRTGGATGLIGGSPTGGVSGAGGGGRLGSGGAGTGATPGNGGAGGTVGGTTGTGTAEAEIMTSGQSSYWVKGTATMVTSGTADLNIDNNTTYQRWDGFGGTFNEKGWDALSVLGADDVANAMKLLYDANDGANFAYGGIPTPRGRGDSSFHHL
jgi:hypothetical protein